MASWKSTFPGAVYCTKPCVFELLGFCLIIFKCLEMPCVFIYPTLIFMLQLERKDPCIRENEHFDISIIVKCIKHNQHLE